jgi:hypothetical protein
MFNKKSIIISLVAGIILFISTPTFAKCFIFVHGHQDHALSYSQAYDYWEHNGSWWNPFDNDRTMLSTVAAGSANKYAIINYDSTQPYWMAAINVANKINNVLNGVDTSCSGQVYFRVVSHSMGGAVMDFIFGNARTSDPYYNFGGANFANINSRIYRHLSVQGAHRGTYGADAMCGSAGATCNFLADIVSTFTGGGCDSGTQWLQTADSWQVRTYSGSPGTTTWLFGGYEAIIGSSSCLAGEDDGLLAYPSSFACAGSATASYSTSNVCLSKQESYGFRDAGQFHENHDDGRADSDRDTVRAVYGGLWGSISTGTKVRSSDSSAEIIHEVWAD